MSKDTGMYSRIKDFQRNLYMWTVLLLYFSLLIKFYCSSLFYIKLI